MGYAGFVSFLLSPFSAGAGSFFGSFLLGRAASCEGCFYRCLLGRDFFFVGMMK